MKLEILALLPGDPVVPRSPDYDATALRDFTAVTIPATPPWIAGPALRRHRLKSASRRQRWLEQLMTSATVLPFAPGHTLERDEIERMIIANSEMLGDLVTRLGGKVQYQVTVSWSENEVLHRFRSAPEIAPLFDAGAVSGGAVAGAVSRLASRLSQVMAARLDAVAVDCTELPLEQGALLNAVLLIQDGREAALDAVLEEIDGIWPEGLRIRQIGPGPAVSFATLRLVRQRPSDVTRALTCLGLKSLEGAEEIGAARNRLLRDPASDANEIRTAARIATAAARLGRTDRAFHLIDLWSEGRSVQSGLEQVA